MHEMKLPLKVFLYHRSGDKEIARDLYLRLIKDGVDARLVKEKILPSQDWKHEICEAVRDADVVLVCLSNRSTQGESRRKEVQAAFNAAIEQLRDELFVIPVHLEECERPDNLEKWHGVDLFAELGYDMLMYALQGRADQVGASIQRKESLLPEISTTSVRHEESATEDRGDETLREFPEVLVEGPGILIEGATVDLQGSVVQRKPGRVRTSILALISLTVIIVMAVLDPPWLERWYQLALTFDLGQVTGSSTAKVSESIYRTPNANIVFLIDTSSSMQGQRLSMVKSAVSDFISDLDEEYLISIMSFDTNVEMRTGLTHQHTDASETIKSIDISHEEYSSCVGDALYAGMQEILFTPIANDTENILVFVTDTDGWGSNCRVPFTRDIYMNSNHPFSVFVISLTGNNYLMGMATETGGKFFSAYNKKEIDKALLSISKNTNLALDTDVLPSSMAETAVRQVPMVFVPPGEFMMGNNNNMVYLDAFWIDKTEVTNGMYLNCVQSGYCRGARSFSSKTRYHYSRNPDFYNYPVIFIPWEDANNYCNWAGKRLPTEAEWEKAARGTDGRRFPWGNAEPWIGLLNYQAQDTTEVGRYLNGASPYGALDMAGNVGEWVADWLSDLDYANPPISNPLGPKSGEYRVWRGGSWANTSTDWILTTSRTGNLPTDYNSGLGFRCARDASP